MKPIWLRFAAILLPAVLLASCGSVPPARANYDGGMIWGVNGHPFQAYPGISYEEQLDYVVDLGMTHYRVDVGNLNQRDSLLRLMDAAEARGVQILPILIPPVRLDDMTPDELRTLSHEFAVTWARLLKDRVPVFELGNELEVYAIIQPCEMRDDGKQYPCEWGPAGGVEAIEYYGPRWEKVSAVLKGLSEGVGEVVPDAQRAIGTAGWGHTGAYDRMAADGIEWEITVWHSYEYDDEWAFERISKFGKPIWVTEFNNPRGSTNGEEAQTAGLLQMMQNYRDYSDQYGITAAFIYELLDETYWAPNWESEMGLVELVPDPRRAWRTAGPKHAYGPVREFVRKARGLDPAAPEADAGN